MRTPGWGFERSLEMSAFDRFDHELLAGKARESVSATRRARELSAEGRETLCAELSPYLARRRLRGGRDSRPSPLPPYARHGGLRQARVMPYSHRP